MSQQVNNKNDLRAEESRYESAPKTTFLPIINWEEQRTYCSAASKSEYIRNTPFIPYSGKLSENGRAFKFQKSSSSSVGAKLSDGDILFCESVDHHKQKLIPLQLYVLVLKDEFLCRRFFREDRHYEFRPDDPSACHLIMSANLIEEIWEVKSILRTKIPVPEDLFNAHQINTYKYSTL